MKVNIIFKPRILTKELKKNGKRKEKTLKCSFIELRYKRIILFPQLLSCYKTTPYFLFSPIMLRNIIKLHHNACTTKTAACIVRIPLLFFAVIQKRNHDPKVN